MERAFSLTTADGVRIACLQTLGDDAADVVILLHGLTTGKAEFGDFYADAAGYFTQRGLGALRFDFRGHGESGGTSLDFTVVGQMLDLDAVVRHVLSGSKRPRLHLVGTSFGAPPAIFGALRYAQDVASVSLIAPVLSYEETFLTPTTEWGREHFGKKAEKALETTGWVELEDGFRMGRHLFEEMRLIVPIAMLKRLHAPVLLLHGESDSMVPFPVSERAAKAIPMLRFVPMAEVDHGFPVVGDEEGTSSGSARSKAFIFDKIAEHIA